MKNLHQGLGRQQLLLAGPPYGSCGPQHPRLSLFQGSFDADGPGVVGSSGQKCSIVVVGTGEEVNVDVYQDLLRQRVVPWVQRTYPDGNYVSSRIWLQPTSLGTPTGS